MIRNLVTKGQNIQRDWTVVPVLGILMGPYDNVGGGFHAVAVLGHDVGMTMGTHAGDISGTN